MGQLSSSRAVLEALADLIRAIGLTLGRVLGFIVRFFGRLGSWLRLRFPFVEAYFQRHLNNPAAIFFDLAIFVLALYIIVGIVGYVAIYHKKSESRATEIISVLYPFPAIRVENQIVWSHRFLQRLRFFNTFNRAGPPEAQANLPDRNELRQRVINGLVEDRILFLEAKKRGISVSREELEAAFTAQQASVPNLENQIKTLYGMSIDEFKQIIAERLLKEEVTQAAIATIRVRHILVKTDAAANEVRRRLDAGEDFAVVAKQLSADNRTKDSGGDLGFWSKNELHNQISPAFEQAAFGLAINTTSSPVPSQFGIHIIQVTERSEGEYLTYDEWFSKTKEQYRVAVYIKP